MTNKLAPVLTIFGLAVPSYTLLILIGFGAGYASIARRGSVYRITPDEIAAIYILAAVGAFIGGKIFFMIQGLPQYLAQPVEERTSLLDYIQQAGLVFYGGLFGSLAATAVAARAFRTPFFTAVDAILPAMPLAQCFGRIGCLLAGCCYGFPTSHGLLMPGAQGVPADTRLFPVQLVESAWCFVLFIFLWRLGRVRQQPGRLLGVYLCGYGAARFVLEYLRYDAVRGTIGALSVSQWISISACASGIVLLIRSGSAKDSSTAETAF